MKYQKHYLADEKGSKFCPLNEGNCDSYCAWFDHKHQDCRMIGGFWKVREGLNELIDIIKEDKNARREFKF